MLGFVSGDLVFTNCIMGFYHHSIICWDLFVSNHTVVALQGLALSNNDDN